MVINHSIKKYLFLVILAIVFTSSNIVTFEYLCDYPERGPKFYGFPSVQQADTSWVNSMSGEIYVLGFLGNLLFWMAIVGSAFFMLSKVKQVLTKAIINVLVCLFFVLSMYFSLLNFTMVDWNLKWTHHNFKIGYYKSEIVCKRNVVLFFLTKNKVLKQCYALT